MCGKFILIQRSFKTQAWTVSVLDLKFIARKVCARSNEYKCTQISNYEQRKIKSSSSSNNNNNKRKKERKNKRKKEGKKEKLELCNDT